MKTLLIKIVFFISVLPGSLFAQETAKYGFDLRNYLKTANPLEQVPLLVEGSSTAMEALVLNFNGTIRLKVGNLFSIEIPAQYVKEFSENSVVSQIEFSSTPGRALSDTMLIQTNVDSIINHAGSLRNNYTGKGVVLGVIDSGIELAHPDFQDSLGKTRVMYVWDQRKPFDPNRQALNYNYGIEWDSTEINAGSSSHDDSASEFGHGSNVTGAAASNGLASGQFRGVAPEVNIIAVATDFNKPNWLQTVAESVDYIYKKADAMGMPCVINASVGTYIGSHDGKDIAARIINALINQRNGRAFVCAAGNAGNQTFHVQQNLNSDTAFTWFEDNFAQFSGFGGVYFEVWSDTANFNNLQFSIGADSENGSNFRFRGRSIFDNIQNRLNVIYNDSIVGLSGNNLARIQTYAEESQGRYKLEVEIFNPDTANLLYRFETRGTGKIDIYSSYSLFRHNDMRKTNLPSLAQFPAIAKYTKPDSLQTMVSSFTCLPSAISVGNYTNRATYTDVSGTFRRINVTPGQIAASSSLGPNRTNFLKPDVSSAGDYMFGTGRLATINSLMNSSPNKISQDSLHWRNGGTSMASPTVAGMVALYLQMCPKAPNSQIKADLIGSSKKDQFTTINSNYTYGNGKADGFRFLKKQVFSPTVNFILPNICDGDSLDIFVNANYNSYKWNNGDTTISTNVKIEGKYFSLVENQWGCLAPTDTAYIDFDSIPNQPTIIRNGFNLSLNEVGFYQWYKNQIPIIGATNSGHIVLSSGDYFCKYSDNNGCSVNSDTLPIIVTSLQKNELLSSLIFPNPSRGMITIETPQALYRASISIYNLQGKRIFFNKIQNGKQQFVVDLSPISSGIYFLELNSSDQSFHKKIILE